jgi:hypothetical protein
MASKIATLDTSRSDLPREPVDVSFERPTSPLTAPDSPDPADYLDPRDWLDFLPVEYVEELLPVGTTRLALWTPRNDPADAFFTAHNRLASRDEYRHLLCYGHHNEVAPAAFASAMDTLRSTSAPVNDSTTSAMRLLEPSFRTLRATAGAGSIRVAYFRRFKAQAPLPHDFQIEERHIYSRFFDAPPRAEGLNALDTLHRAFDDKRLELGLHAAAKSSIAAQFRPDRP